MPKCGECRMYFPPGASPAANSGFCGGILDEDDLPTPTDLYADASECSKFVAMERIRTNTSEFMADPNLRIARGFEEK